MAVSPPPTGSGKNQITPAGQTKGRYANPDLKVKGDEDGTEQRIKIKG
jgi:hypothetical protein